MKLVLQKKMSNMLFPLFYLYAHTYILNKSAAVQSLFATLQKIPDHV